MVKILFENTKGVVTKTTAKLGETLMETAINHGVQDILAECGGACACGTCHVYVPESHMGALKQADEMEEAMLEFVENPKSNSRLSCQIEVTEALEGMKVKIAEA